MKRLVSAVIAVAVVAGCAALVFAQTPQQPAPAKMTHIALHAIRGTIVSIDQAKNEIVLKDAKTGKDKTFMVPANEISSLKAGERVKIILKAGSDTVDSIQAIKTMEHKKQ